MEATNARESVVTGHMKLIVVAAAALIRDGRVLLAQRPEGKPLAGKWEFPGGKLEFLGGKLDEAPPGDARDEPPSDVRCESAR